MLIVCAGMYRACSTWQYEVAAHLVEQYHGGKRLGYLTPGDFVRWWSRAPTGWYVLKAHEGHPAFARALRAGQARVLTSHRDARDVVFSMTHKLRLSFDRYVERGMVRQVLVNHRFWSRQPNALRQSYQDLIERPEEGVGRIAAFLGAPLGPAQVAELAAAYSLEANRRRTDALANRLQAAGINLDDPSNALLYDQDSLLHWNHLRQGTIGGWRDEATREQRWALQRMLGDWLIENGYETDAHWADADRPDWRRRLMWTARIARGDMACRLRGVSLRFPHLSGRFKALVGLRTTQGTATPVPSRARSNQLVDTTRDHAVATGGRP